MSDLLNSASLVMIPSGYKEDVVYSQIPTSGAGDLSFTRASDGTRINSQGLVEVCPWNLITNSQTFSSWAKVEVGATVTVTDNFVTAPNGTLTGAKVVFSNFSGNAQIFANYSLSSTQNLTSTLYAKVPSGTRQCYFGFYDGSGKVELKTLTTEWQRIEYTGSITAGGGVRACWFYGDGGASNVEVHLWGGQLNVGSTAKPYFPTTDRLNVPRLTYQNGGGGCPSLLLEPQRTNLLSYSQEFDNAYWGKQSGATVTANTAISPDGTQNADTINLVSGSTISRIERAAIAYTASTAYTLTFYFKNISLTSGQTFLMRFEGNGFDLRGTIDLANNTNTVSLTGTAVSGFVSGSQRATLEECGNGWIRCSIGLTTGTNSGNITVYLITNVDANRSFYAYGAQLEAGAYPSTYIPTTSSSATRVADAFSRNNIYTNGLITSSGGTWFISLLNNVLVTRDTSDVGLFIGNSSNGVSGDVLAMRNNGTARLAITKRIAGSQTLLFDTTTDTVKVAIKWDGTNADVFVNGTKVVSATAFATTNMEFFNGKGADVTKFISQMDLFPTPLTDAECQALTTI